MPAFSLTLPVASTNPARVDAWLTAHGYTVQDGSSLHGDGTVTVLTDRDPSADVQTYTDAPTSAEQLIAAAVTTLRAYLTTVRAIAPALRTPEQKALLSVAVLVHDLAQAAT